MFRDLSYKCYYQVKDNYYDGIIAVLNGGVYLADFLSKKMNLPIFTIDIKSYNGQQKGEIQLVSYTPLKSKNDKFLIVDDIYDSGETLKKIKEFYNFYEINNLDEIVLVSKNKKIKHGLYLDTNEWIDFFWEKI